MRTLLFLVLFASTHAFAAIGPVHFDDPARADLYDHLLEEIRCLVCQNQSLSDSNAELAQDLRNEIIAMIRDGKSEQDIKAFLVERYGDFVLYRPPLQENTWLLWVGPFLLLLVGIVVAIVIVKRQAGNVSEPVTLSSEQQQRLEALNSDQGRDSS